MGRAKGEHVVDEEIGRRSGGRIDSKHDARIASESEREAQAGLACQMSPRAARGAGAHSLLGAARVADHRAVCGQAEIGG
eukprot:15457692-Alexandrium_andersonii.AAC.1